MLNNKFKVIDSKRGLTVNLTKLHKINIYGLTDIHIGSTAFNKKKFEAAINRIKKDPIGYTFINGDIVEFILPHSRISQRGQEMFNEDQLITAMEYLKQIKNKILFIRPGNHDTDRGIAASENDVIKTLAHGLDVPYYPLPGYMTINLKKGSITIASGHGVSGSPNGNTELLKMKKIYPDADVYYLGHNHQLFANRDDSFKFGKNGEVYRVQYMIRGGSFVEYADYARKNFYSPSPTGYIIIETDGNTTSCHQVI